MTALSRDEFALLLTGMLSRIESVDLLMPGAWMADQILDKYTVTPIADTTTPEKPAPLGVIVVAWTTPGRSSTVPCHYPAGETFDVEENRLYVYDNDDNTIAIWTGNTWRDVRLAQPGDFPDPEPEWAPAPTRACGDC